MTFGLLSAVAFGIVSASPGAQSETGRDWFAFLVAVLTDANDKGLLSDDLSAAISDYVIEKLVAPHSSETLGEARDRLSSEGQSSFRFLIAVLRDADSKGVMPDMISELLSAWVIENFIAPHTGETPEQATQRLSGRPISTSTAATPAPTQTLTSTPTATATATSAPTQTPTPLPTTVGEVVENVEKAVVLIYSDTGQGTGVIVDSVGRLVTNAHVVGEDSSVRIIMHDDSTYEADVLGVDEQADVAVVQLPSERLFHAALLGDSDLVRVGDATIVMGYPLGLKTVTSGIVSAKLVLDDVEYIQTDSAINPGNSGGPLLNAAGKVIGINAWRYDETRDGKPLDNLGFAIAINEVKARLPGLTAGRSVLDPSPDPAPDPEDGWNRYKNGEYGYSIDVPPLWSFSSEFEDESRARFRSSDGAALLEASAYDVPASYSLRQFAEYRRDALAQAASNGSWDVFEVESFDRVDETEDEFYLLRYRYQPSPESCVSQVFERIRLSNLYPDKPYGFGMSFSICEDSLAAHIFDREATLGTFIEWDRYASPTYGYSVNVAPNWVLDTVLDSGGTSVISPARGGGVVNIKAYNVSTVSTSLRGFAQWRDRQLRGEAERWDEFEPHFLLNKRKQTGGRDAYITAYTARKSSGHCLAGYIDLIALSSYYSYNRSGFVVFTGVCLRLMGDLNEDRLEMLDSFRY